MDVGQAIYVKFHNNFAATSFLTKCNFTVRLQAGKHVGRNILMTNPLWLPFHDSFLLLYIPDLERRCCDQS